LLGDMEREFAANRPGLATDSHREAYKQAVRMMRSSAVEAFDLEQEPAAVREKYGRSRFGQACLLARRLVEQGVPFVEISLSGVDGQQAVAWDTHSNNFATLQTLCGALDPAWATLVEDLHQRGLLDSTLITWMGEFGRTPRINGAAGRDHFPNAWTTVLCGGGVRGGQMYGRTSADGEEVADNPVTVSQLLATVCGAVGVDHNKQNLSNVGRPIGIVEPNTSPIAELLA
jgi:uncharacterized protein (DUF1501 family)